MGKVMVERAVGLNAEALVALLEDKYPMADRVVVDSGPGKSEDKAATLSVAEFVVVVTNSSWGADLGVEVLETTCDSMGKGHVVVDNCGESFPEVAGVQKILMSRKVPPDFEFGLQELADNWIGGARIVSVVAEKGGVGKTTIALALALYYAHDQGENVLVLDMDNQAGCATNVLLGKQGKTGQRVKWDGFPEEAPGPKSGRIR